MYNLKKISTPSFCCNDSCPGGQGFTPVPCLTGPSNCSEWPVTEERKAMSETQYKGKWERGYSHLRADYLHEHL